jgi:hypothetical protein
MNQPPAPHLRPQSQLSPGGTASPSGWSRRRGWPSRRSTGPLEHEGVELVGWFWLRDEAGACGEGVEVARIDPNQPHICPALQDKVHLGIGGGQKHHVRRHVVAVVQSEQVADLVL